MKVPAARPFFPNEDIGNILSDIKVALETGALTLGPFTKKFEEEFAQYTGVKHAIVVNSGTASLEIILRHLDVKDKEVIVPTNTFISCANVAVYAGGKPVLADINEKTLCIDTNSVLEKITSKTKVIMAVHLAGLICPNINELKEICEDKGIFLLEDAAQAHGAMIGNKKAGDIGDAGSFSFFPTKPMTSGEGGMVVTNNGALAKTAISLRHHGIQKRDYQDKFGYNWRLSEVSAVLGLYQLRRLEEFIKKRNEIADKYNKRLRSIKEVKLIEVPKNSRHSYYKYIVILPQDSADIQQRLKEKYEIDTSYLYYPPVHLQPLYREKFGYKEGMLPVAEGVLKKMVCLPMFVGLTDEQIEYVINSFQTELASMPA